MAPQDREMWPARWGWGDVAPGREDLASRTGRHGPRTPRDWETWPQDGEDVAQDREDEAPGWGGMAPGRGRRGPQDGDREDVVCRTGMGRQPAAHSARSMTGETHCPRLPSRLALGIKHRGHKNFFLIKVNLNQFCHFITWKANSRTWWYFFSLYPF